MKIKDHWDDYAFYTEKLTELSRQLAFAGAAICWFFKTPDVTFPTSILLALIGLVIFFISDIMQYLFSAILLKCWLRPIEKEAWKKHKSLDVDIDRPSYIDKPAFLLFIIKIILLISSFILILSEFFKKLLI